MTYSNYERQILACVELDARATNETVARRIRSSTERVARTRLRMIEDRRIEPRVFLNSMALGLLDAKLFFSLTSCSQRQRSAVLRMLAELRGVSWLGSYAGDYRFGLTYYCKHPLELNDLLDQVGERFPDLFSTRSVLLRSAYVALQRAWLQPQTEMVKIRREFGLQRVATPAKIDELDSAILFRLGGRAFSSLRDLARELGEVPTTISRRVATLEAHGVIVGYYYNLSLQELGIEIYRILLSFSSLTRARRAALYAFARKHRRSVYVIESLGAWDFELGFEVERGRDINEIVNELYQQTGEYLRDLKILTELEELHSHYFPFPPLRSSARRFEIG